MSLEACGNQLRFYKIPNIVEINKDLRNSPLTNAENVESESVLR